MNLTPRLQQVMDQIPHGARVADIGTDHGKLPIALLLQDRVESVIGSDVRSGPLRHAKKNLCEHGLQSRCRLVLADGLSGVLPTECDTVTICGMGGETIAAILQAAPWTANGNHLLLLQPMTMIEELRCFLWSNGYAIETESLCREGHRFYLLLAVRGGAVRKQVPAARCVLSNALLKDPLAEEYLLLLKRRQEKIRNGLMRAKEKPGILLTETIQKLEMIDAAMKEIK